MSVARSATTSDAFNAIAEPQRRRILNFLTHGEYSVNEIAEALDMRQPQASKHLRVLKQVGLVRVRGSGQQRLYSLESEGLKPVRDWVVTFEQFWSDSYDRLEEIVQQRNNTAE